MPLKDLNLLIPQTETPGDVRHFLREANRRIQRFWRHCSIPGFVPSDYERVYSGLRALAEADLVPGNLFCEWGSGFGVVACLAAMLDFDASGVEVEAELVDAARRLAEDFDLPVEFVHDSFIPRGGQTCVGAGDGFRWLATQEAAGHDELGPDDFDVVFAFPWPDEEVVIAQLFERFSGPDAVLATYHDTDVLRLRRKVTKKRPRFAG